MNLASLSTPSNLSEKHRWSVATQTGVSLRELLTIFFRDYKRIGAVFFLCLFVTGIASTLPRPKYTSEAALLLRLGREYIYTPEVGEPVGGAPVAYDREQTLMAEARILSSRDLKEMVLDKLGVTAIYPQLVGQSVEKQRDQAMLMMERALDAELLKGSNLMQVSFTHSDREVAAQVLSAVIDAYLQKRSVIFASANYGTAEADFVKRTMQLNEAETKLAELKKTRGIRAFSEEQSLLLAQRNAIDAKLGDVNLALAFATGRDKALKDSLQQHGADVVLSSEVQHNDALENTRKLVQDLTQKERELKTRYADTSPQLQEVRADLQRAQSTLRELELRPTRTERIGRSPVRDTTESELVRTQADQQQSQSGMAALLQQRAAIERRLDAFTASERELRVLELERKLAESNYEAAAKRLRDEMVLEDLDRKRKSNVSIVQPPTPPLAAKSVRAIVLSVGVFVSFCAALLTALLSALWRDTYITPEEVERSLGLPLLASVPEGAV